MQNKNRWVQVWGQSHTALSLFYYPKKARTYRIVINTAISGEKMRVRLSNAYGKEKVYIQNVTAAVCDKYGNIKCENDIKICTLSSKESFILNKGEWVVLDQTYISLSAGDYFCISVYVTKGNLCSGNLMSNALLLTGDGNMTKSPVMKNKLRIRDSVIHVCGNLLNLPLHRPIPLFDTVELYNTEDAKSILVFGDSLSQQGYWTIPFEKRLTETFPKKYTLINRSAMGNRILRDCSEKFIFRGLYANRALNRIKEDVFVFENISHCILFIGINDIIQPGTPDAFSWEKANEKELCQAIANMTKALQEKNIKVMLFTIPSFGASINGSKEKDLMRRKVNVWIKENSDLFDYVFDICEVTSDKNDDYFTCEKYLGPDKLHFDAFGGEVIANAIPLDFFKVVADSDEKL